MNARKRNPRVVVVEKVREMKRLLGMTVSTWTVCGTIYVPQTHAGEVRSTSTRPRQPDEYPENQAAYWRDLYRQMIAVGHLAEQVQGLAKVRYQAIMAERQTDGET